MVSVLLSSKPSAARIVAYIFGNLNRKVVNLKKNDRIKNIII